MLDVHKNLVMECVLEYVIDDDDDYASKENFQYDMKGVVEVVVNCGMVEKFDRIEAEKDSIRLNWMGIKVI